VGLARPISPTAKPLVTHRGMGAFCDKDFVKKDVGLHEDNDGPEQDGDIHEECGENSADRASASGDKIDDENDDKNDVFLRENENKSGEEELLRSECGRSGEFSENGSQNDNLVCGDSGIEDNVVENQEG